MCSSRSATSLLRQAREAEVRAQAGVVAVRAQLRVCVRHADDGAVLVLDVPSKAAPVPYDALGEDKEPRCSSSSLSDVAQQGYETVMHDPSFDRAREPPGPE